ncbi:MAG: hypothetical protein R2762_26165 [Bryobacteraceae bacterium]
MVNETKKKTAPEPPPDQRPLTKIQAERLSALSGVSARELAGATVAQISEKYRWKIDFEILGFRRVCGKVVKRDPVTGVEYPVPFATVHVEDTDCNLLGFFPPGNPWLWFFPFLCRREVIATVKTDQCGRFCVWIPRWDIDWILRFRRERICFPDIFIKPNLRDLLEVAIPPFRVPPGPDPDPPPFLLRDGGMTLRHLEAAIGREQAERLAGLEIAQTLGGNAKPGQDLLAGPAFASPVPPPLPPELRPGLVDKDEKGTKAELQLPGTIKIDPAVLRQVDFRRWVGPFRRCVDILVPEWHAIVDVPDITFRVTQDVDGDGNEETIYSEGYFDVRWNAGPIPDVTLEASPIAIAGLLCDAPDVPCGNTPAILFAGRHPLVNPALPADPYHDNGTGYARRVNRPHPTGALVDPPPNPLAETPYASTLSLFGCNRIGNAKFYRVRYSHNGSPVAPFTGLTWPLYRLGAGGALETLWPAADGAGWYPVLPQAENWFPDLLLLDWNTAAFADGVYTLDLQLGNAAKNVVATSAQVRFVVDNSRPSFQFTKLRWRKSGGAWHDLPLACAVIPRGVVPSDIDIEVSFTSSAAHMRSVRFTAGGCGAGGNPTLSSALSTVEHWHVNAADNTFNSTAIYSVAAVQPAGAYSLGATVAGRAFNPSGGDGGQLVDWNYNPVIRYITPSMGVAIVNAD